MNKNHTIVCGSCDTTNRIPEDKLRNRPVCGKCKSPLFLGKALEVNGNVFHRHIEKTSLPVLVDFWAPWCGPCKMMTPVFKEAAEKLEPEMRLIKLNTEEDQQTAAKFQIRSIPTLAVFRNGREIARQSGAMDLKNLINWVKSVI